MNQDFLKNFEQQLQPLKQLVEINNKAMEKLVQQQNAYMNDVLKASMEQAGKLTSPGDVENFVKTQQEFIAAMSKKLMDAAQQNMNVMNEAREATAKLIQDAVKDATKLAK